MGVVYRAQDPRIDRTVAIKTIHAGLMQGAMASELSTRFIREIRAVGNLRHPNIIAIYDTDEENGMPFFVMEYVEGRELSQLLQEQVRFSIDQVLHIGRQLLSAFAYTHQRGIIHRDIKPANIFITNEGDVKVADFGIAKVENSELTQVGTSLGTPSYMSPEQCTGQPVDKRADLFSIGVVLYQLLTGEKPFQGSSTHALMHHIVRSTPEKPSVLNPALPAAVDKLMEKALAKNPADRFQSAEEFAVALEAALAGRPLPGSGTKHFWLWLGGAATATYALCLALFFALRPALVPATADPIDASDLGITPVTSPVTLTPEQQDKVDKFLKLAQLSIDSGRLVWPPTSNAVYVYRLALEIDPSNARAQAGLRDVLTRLVEQGRELQRQNDAEALAKHLEISLQAFPNARQLLALREAAPAP